jgi:hypothetical protein
MATRAIIAKLDDKGVKAIYSHSDNYLEHTGKILDQHYQNEDKVDELLAHGDVSIVDENIGVKIDFNDYKLRAANKQCLFYDRDRGEKYKQAEQFKDENVLLKYAFEECDVDLAYMFAYGSWYVYDNSDKIGDSSYQFIELEEALYVRI